MSSNILEQSPPHAVEAEMSLLGSVLLDPDVITEVTEIISGPEDFYDNRNAAIYEQASFIIDEQGSVDMVRLAQRMIDKGMIDQVGGVDYISSLYEATPSASNAAWYARIVKEKSDLRKIITASSDALQECYRNVSSTDIADKVAQVYLDIGDPLKGKFQSGIGDMMVQLMGQLESREANSMTGVPCSFTDLDSLLNGMHRGEMIIVAGRPSQGKTALGLNMSGNMSAMGIPTGFISLEMTREGLANRMLSSYSGVDAMKMRKNILSTQDYTAIINAARKIEKMPMQIDDTPGLSITQLRAKARRMKKKYGIQALFIDYMQLLTGGSKRYSSRQEEVSSISRGIKSIARELDVPVICLSQLNRGNEQRENKRPRMSDLRESGAIEQDADVVMMVHREDYYHKGDDSYTPNNTGEIIVEKQRNGPTGIVKLFFDGKTTSFKNMGYR